MILRADLRQRPEPGAKSFDHLPVDVISAEADTYDAAKADLDARVPDGWQMISVRSSD